jgi:hypothetical protein
MHEGFMENGGVVSCLSRSAAMHLLGYICILCPLFRMEAICDGEEMIARTVWCTAVPHCIRVSNICHEQPRSALRLVSYIASCLLLDRSLSSVVSAGLIGADTYCWHSYFTLMQLR